MESTAVYSVDSVPVASLTDRFNVGRTAIYDRLKALGIEPEKRGRVSHISGQQLEKMDELDVRLKAGELMPVANTERPVNNLASLSTSTDAAILTLAAMLRRPIDPLANHEYLQRCADRGWLLRTAQLREFVGKVPNSTTIFKRMGFTFTKCDREWKVTANVYTLDTVDQSTVSHLPNP